MKRSVRNGVAIAGMVGGFWLLGQAVAQAEQVNDVGQENNQSATSEDGGATGNAAGNFNSSENKTEVDVETDVDGGDGGANYSNVNTGVQGAVIIIVADDAEQQKVLDSMSAPPNGDSGGSSDATGVVDIETDDVSVEQNANGGDVDGSGNVNELPDLPDQTNNVDQSNDQSATSEDDHGWKKDEDNKGEYESLNGNSGNGHGGLTGNLAGNFNESENKTEVDIETDVEGGDGGENYSNVNTGLQGVIFKCIAEGGGDAKCIFNISTGSVTVIQNANGGNVSDSGNVGNGKDRDDGKKDDGRHDGKKDDGRHDGKKDDGKDRPDYVVPDKAPAAPVYVPVSDKQPTGELAYTGADVSLPLTAGLLALGLGVGLTAAGRRRATQLG